MQVLQYQNKGAHLNTIERYFIYKEFYENNQLNDEHNISPNKIFDALLKGTPQAINPSSPITPTSWGIDHCHTNNTRIP
jgi:hypothetical protein